jgi:hypothetical protein
MTFATDSRLIDLALMAPEIMADWYEISSQDIEDYSRRLELSADFVADIVAILSPRIQVSRNARIAHQFITTDDTTGIMGNRIQAIDYYRRTGKVSQSGQKVRNFSANLRGNFELVTIDVWMSRAFGVGYDSANSPAKSDATYARMAGKVTRLARRFNVSPASMQACIWSGIRQEHGIKDDEAYLTLTNLLPSGVLC